MTSDPAGLPLLLLAGFRVLINALHTQLADRGHPDVRPVHGFAMQAVLAGADSSVALAESLGVSKQAASKTVESLERLGYLARVADPDDGRRRLLQVTPHGRQMLTESAEILAELRSAWVAELGAPALNQLEEGLRRVTRGSSLRTDAIGWFGS